ASTIRNPVKFMHVFSWALVILFSYGVHGLYTLYLKDSVSRLDGIVAQFKAWHAKAAAFDRKWLYGCVAAVGVSLLAWLFYFSNRSKLEAYIQTVNIDAATAPGVAAFSMRAVGWFILFLVITIVLLALIFSGQFSGSRSRWAGIFLGGL